jgi:short-subunit dehydrogenase
MKPHGKVFVVTGGGSGMERELVLQLLARGAAVAAVDIHADALAETLRLAAVPPARLQAFTTDLSQREAVEALATEVIGRFGRVDGLINSSLGGFLPVPGQTIYGASKAAVKLMTEGLHSELMETGVHVTVVFPGAIATNIVANSGLTGVPGGADAKSAAMKTTPAEVAARIILDGIEKNAYRILVGPDARLMDALCRLAPERAAAFIYKQMRSLLPA